MYKKNIRRLKPRNEANSNNNYPLFEGRTSDSIVEHEVSRLFRGDAPRAHEQQSLSRLQNALDKGDTFQASRV